MAGFFAVHLYDHIVRVQACLAGGCVVIHGRDSDTFFGGHLQVCSLLAGKIFKIHSQVPTAMAMKTGDSPHRSDSKCRDAYRNNQ